MNRNETEGQKPTLIELDRSLIGASLEPAFAEGVSGLFAGVLGEWLIFGGGCNFPSSNPSQKVYYSSLYAMRQRAGGSYETISLAALQAPIGYGASLLSDQGNILYLVGGTDGSEARREIYEVTLQAGKPMVRLSEVQLPHGWYEGSAALIEDNLYLVGGWKGLGTPHDTVTRVSLKSGASETLEELPEGSRIQPVAFAHNGFIYLFGGFRPAQGAVPPHMHRRAYRLDPSQQGAKWEVIAENPQLENGRKLLFVGSSVVRDPVTLKVYMAGGVDYDVFEQALNREYAEAKAHQAGDTDAIRDFEQARKAYLSMPEESYHFLPYLLRFSPEANRWEVVTQDTAYATAGAALAVGKDATYLVGGERKPRVRTPDIWRTPL
ncbi:MAG: hypothetical protein Q4D93_04190 [Porphyromonas sp.]|nr:hypothetical protein [Porphyromonas sp.]